MSRAFVPTAEVRRAVAAATASSCALAMVVLGAALFGSLAVRTRDAVLLQGFTGLDRSAIDSAIRGLALSVNPAPYATLGLALVGVCLAQRRLWRAATSAIVLIGSGASAQVLKSVLATPRDPSFGNGFRPEDIGWPSGHAAAGTALAICAIIVSPALWRGFVALAAGGYVAALAFATLALTWHYPSEVLGGILLAGVWGGCGLAALTRLEASEHPVRALAPPWAVIAWGTAGALAAALITFAAAAPLALPADDRAQLTVCAFAIVMLVLALLFVTILAAPPDDGAGGSPRP